MHRLLLASMCMIIGLAAVEPADDGPIAPGDWELPAEHLRDNGLRGDVPLNGWWAVEILPPTAEQQAKLDAERQRRERERTKESERAAARGGARGEAPKPPPTPPPPAEAKPAPAKLRVPDGGSRLNVAWSRDVALPAGWERRRLTLWFSLISRTGSLEIDGRPIAEVPGWGQRYSEVEVPRELAADGRLSLRLTTGSIQDDVQLRSYPADGPRIDDSWIITSVRERRVELRLSGRGTAGAALRATLRIYRDARATDEVKTLAGTAIADAAGAWSTTLASPWADARLWRRSDPFLHWYVVELQDAAGALVDRTLPRPFGFREVWMRGREVMLNDAPVHFMGDTFYNPGNGHTCQRELADAIIANARSMNLSGGFRFGTQLLDACDRGGMIVSYHYLGGLDVPANELSLVAPDEAGDAGGDVDDVAAQDRLLAERERYQRSRERMLSWWCQDRERPAIMSWLVKAPWSRVTLNSLLTGRADEPWRFWPGNGDEAAEQRLKLRYDAASAAIRFVRGIDPTRPVAAQNNPDADIEYATRYLCDNLDLQEREQFFEDYARSGSRRALWTAEHGTPFQGHQFLRASAFQLPQGVAWPAIHVENAARLFGDEVYLQEPDERLRNWPKWYDEQHRASPVYQRLLAENIRLVHRGWRTAGVSSNAHWIARDGWIPDPAHNPRTWTVEERWGVPAAVDPRRPGRSTVSTSLAFPATRVDQELPAGTAYRQAMAPVLAYIADQRTPGGKEHLYTAGDEMRKQVVALNDLDRPVAIAGRWRLLGTDGGEVAGGSIAATLAPGERAVGRIALACRLPAVDARTDFTLALDLGCPDAPAATLDDRMSITVFPPTRRTGPVRGTFWLLPFGDQAQARAMLDANGIAARTVDDAARPAAGDVLVLPRRCLPDAVAITYPPAPRPGVKPPAPLPPFDASAHPATAALAAIGFDQLVDEGLRVLVLEQDARNILGLQSEDVRPRRTFIAAPGHPAFAGLQPSDLTCWSGASDLQPAAEPIGEDTRRVFPARIWQVSGDHAVATRTLIRPQLGAARALLVSGFDLHESPLLEVTRGRGRLLFCQLDVSNRYGRDPAATRIVDNLLRYLAVAPVPDPARADIAILAEDAPGVALRREVFRAALPAGADGWGVTRGDLFFRELLYTDHRPVRAPARRLPDTQLPVLEAGDGLPAVVRRETDGRLATTLAPGRFATPWGRMKILRLHAALRLAQGGSAVIGPALRLHGDQVALNPERWTDGFVHPYTAACW